MSAGYSVLRGNAKDLQDHYKLNEGLQDVLQDGKPANSAAEGAPAKHATRDDDLRLLAVRQFVKLVYARRFQNISDQRKVERLVDTYVSDKELALDAKLPLATSNTTQHHDYYVCMFIFDLPVNIQLTGLCLILV